MIYYGKTCAYHTLNSLKKKCLIHITSLNWTLPYFQHCHNSNHNELVLTATMSTAINYNVENDASPLLTPKNLCWYIITLPMNNSSHFRWNVSIKQRIGRWRTSCFSRASVYGEFEFNGSVAHTMMTAKQLWWSQPDGRRATWWAGGMSQSGVSLITSSSCWWFLWLLRSVE